MKYVDYTSNLKSFNPRSREGSDIGQKVDMDTKQTVSIHAPARGATMRVATPSMTS